MKRITRMSWAIALVTFLYIPAGHAQTPDISSLTLNVAEAGTLSDLISPRLRPYITHLKLTGQLNSSDIRVIREMAGSDFWGDPIYGSLAYLDLSEAELVEGGGSYYYNGAMWSSISAYVGSRVSVENLFTHCTKLKSVSLPSSGIGAMKYAFSGCTSLTSVDLPDDLDALVCTFEGCTSLASINIPDSVTFLLGAFVGCTSLTSVDIPDGVKSLSNVFEGCTSLTSVDIPDGVIELDATFWGCTGLTSINLPNSVKSLNSAFVGCTGLTSVDIPDGVTGLDATFWDCKGLTSVDVPATVTRLAYTFKNCQQLKSVNILSEEPLDLDDDDIFVRVPSDYSPGEVYETVSGGDMSKTFEGCSSLQYIRFLSPRPFFPSEYPQLSDNVIIYVPQGAYMAYWLTEWGNYHLAEYDLTGIDTLVRPGTTSVPVEYYSVSGKRLSAPQHGVNIIREADGSTRKMFLSKP